MIFVTVGTTIPFDELIQEVDRLVGEGSITEDVFAQIGSGTYEPRHVRWVRYVPTICDQLDEASLVICHGGVGTVFELIRLGKSFIAVPNPRAAGGHQRDLLCALEAEGLCRSCYDVRSLEKMLTWKQPSLPYKPGSSLPRDIWRQISDGGSRPRWPSGTGIVLRPVSALREIQRATQRRPRRTFRRRWYPFVNHELSQCMRRWLSQLAGTRVLYVGCGVSSSMAREMAERGAEVWCLDIDPELLRIFQAGLPVESRSRIHVVLGDAHAMPVEDAFFDVAFGKAIVHHLDIARFMQELTRVCRPGARFVFCEPLHMNPVIRLVRWLTPELRDPDEHPLKPADLRLIGSFVSAMELEYKNFLSLLCIPAFRMNWPGFASAVHNAMGYVDRFLFRLMPPSRWMAWNVIVSGELRGARTTEDKAVAGGPLQGDG